MNKETLLRLKQRAHVHSEICYGSYQVCGEHHRHDNKCGGKPLICRKKEDKDLYELLKAYNMLMEPDVW